MYTFLHRVYPGTNQNNRLSPLSNLASLAHEDFSGRSVYRTDSPEREGEREEANAHSFYNEERLALLNF